VNQIPPGGIGVEAAERKPRFLVLEAQRSVKAPLDQPRSEVPAIEPDVAGARLETAKKVRRENDASLDVVFLDLVEIEQGELDRLRVFVRQSCKRPQIGVAEVPKPSTHSSRGRYSTGMPSASGSLISKSGRHGDSPTGRRVASRLISAKARNNSDSASEAANIPHRQEAQI
jgi:hypothetical protein